MTAQSLIIGAGGLVGSAIAAHAGAGAIRARVDWSTSQSVVESLRPTIHKFCHQDEDVLTPKRIYWAAGRTVISSSDCEIERELVTFRAALNLVSEQRTSPVTFVLISSAGALFRGSLGSAITESTSPDPLSAYGTMKLDQERLLGALCREHAHRALILRAPTVYGVRQDSTKSQGLVSALIRSIHTSALVSIFVPRDSRRNYLWTDDLARIALKLPDIMSIAPGTSSVRIIATDRSRTIVEVVETVSRIARRRPVVRFMATNYSAEHGFDLTQHSEFAETQQLGPFTSLTEGVHRLLRQSFTANSSAQVYA